MAGVTIKGLDEAQRKLKRLARATPRRILAPAVAAGLAVLGDEVRRTLPVDTGKLRDSTREKVRRGKGTAVRGDVSVSARDKRGRYMYGAADEFGTSKQPGHGTLRKAADSKEGQVYSAMAATIAAGTEREASG